MIQATDFYLLSLQQPRPVPWPEFRREIEADYRQSRAKATCLKHRQVLAIVERLNLAGDGQGEPPRTIATTDQLDLVMVQRFVSAVSPGRSPHSVRSLLMALRAICGWAEERRYVAVSPLRLRKLAKWIGRCPKPTGKRHCTAEEVRTVLALMRQDLAEKQGWAQWRARRLYAVTATLAYTGLRRNECMCLHVADVDLERGLIDLVPRTPSGRLKTEASAQPVAMPAALVPILREWLDHRLDHPEGFVLPPPAEVPWLFPGTMRIGPWVQGIAKSRINHRVKAVAARAGVKMTPQILRRTWATRAEALGVPQILVTRQMRHADDRTTREFYQGREAAALRDALSGFDF
jgi:integrase